MSGADNTAGKQAGRFVPGQSGNPKGRPRGSRNKLSEDFIADLCADWEQHGAGAIVQVRKENPSAYLKVIASVIPRELTVKSNSLEEMSDEELEAAIVMLRDHILGTDAAGRILQMHDAKITH